MENSIQLFGKKTKQNWIELKPELILHDKKENWMSATQLLSERLETRYFLPIEKIQTMQNGIGEGFAIMTLICSLIEFLQSCYEGKTYQYGANESKTLYGKSGDKFKSFLEIQEPFKSILINPFHILQQRLKHLQMIFI